MYSPGRRAAATYSPAELVVSLRMIPVPVFFTETAAPEMTAPLVSRTVPASVAVSWARAAAERTMNNPHRRMRNCRMSRVCISPFLTRCGRWQCAAAGEAGLAWLKPARPSISWNCFFIPTQLLCEDSSAVPMDFEAHGEVVAVALQDFELAGPIGML